MPEAKGMELFFYALRAADRRKKSLIYEEIDEFHFVEYC